MKWAATFDTFVRYKGRTTRRPLFAVNQNSGETNTNLPEHQNRIEVGGTWMPADNFIATANIGLDNRRHDSAVANFDEDSYPLTFTLWYAPTTRWSLSAGYSHLLELDRPRHLFPQRHAGRRDLRPKNLELRRNRTGS